MAAGNGVTRTENLLSLAFPFIRLSLGYRYGSWNLELCGWKLCDGLQGEVGAGRDFDFQISLYSRGKKAINKILIYCFSCALIATKPVCFCCAGLISKKLQEGARSENRIPLVPQGRGWEVFGR